jgi:DNA polymerase III subunit gamma/tau
VATALYRKYRPRTFAEMVGQEHVTEPLSQALRTGRLHHAYLFSGPRGCGKTTSARILARSLNCAVGPTPEPCGECESCRVLAGEGAGSVDVIEIDAASHGGVDDARDLRERAFFTPVAGRYKIYIIDEAHMVSAAGFNALLKLVEEPPEYVKFIFATTEPEKVLPTIRSRTHHYPFRLAPPGVLRGYLEQLCEAEQVNVEPAVYPLVVRAGGGSFRDSLSVLDQLIAGAGPEGVTYARAVALLGVTDVALLDEVVDALAAGDGAGVFAAVDRVIEAGHDPRRFAADLLERLRDLIVVLQVPDAADKGLLDAPADVLTRMAAQAAQLGLATLTRCAETVHTGLVEMRGTTSPRLLLELICARMLLPGADDSTGALLQRLERMERRLGASDEGAGAVAAPTPGVAGPTPAPASDQSPAASPAAAASPPAAVLGEAPGPPPLSAPPVTPRPASAPPAAGGVLDAAAIRRVWDEVITTVGRHSKRAAAVAREAAVREVEGDTIVLLFQHSVHANMLANSPQPVVDALREVLGGVWQLRCESRDTGSRPAGPLPAPDPPAAPDAGSPSPPGQPAGSDGGGGAADWPEPARPGGTVSGTGGAEGDRSPPRRTGSGRSGRASGSGRTRAKAATPAEPAPPASQHVDEQVDEIADAPMPAQTGEQQALELLQRTLGAEKIGEVAP